MERKMFFGAYAEIFRNAANLRANMTPAEKLLWEELRMNKQGIRFKPQHPMIFYIADFYSYALRLVIEIDGPIHQFKLDYDMERTHAMELAGNKVVRFTNEQVLNQLPDVLKEIRTLIEERRPK
jgi:very-short-patch-repair endonuclease